jgi:hypothetical protein
MTCYEKAWDDWLNTDNIHAISDRPMMKADGGKYLNIISLSAKRDFS